MTAEKYNEILDRMIFCFKEANEETCSQENEYENQYDLEDLFNDNPDKKEIINKSWNRNRQIDEYRNNMKNEGLNLFKKHIWSLWW